MTGRENVFLNGALLGFTREEIEDMYDDIVEFAELEEFMDQKLKNYSSGMQVRLAFSVAIQAKGDILVLDEVLAVGDEAFQRKCDNYFAKVKKDPTKTVILVTHDMGAVKKYCNKAVLIKDGEVIVNGNKDDVANRYTLENMRADKRDTDNDKADEYPTGLNARVPMLRINALSKQILTCDDTFQFEVEYQYDEPNSYYLAIAMHDIKRGGVTYDTGANVIKLNQHGHCKVKFEVPLKLFNNGEFKLVVSLRTQNAENPNLTDMVAFTNDDNCCIFAVRDERTRDYALLNDNALQIKQIR